MIDHTINTFNDYIDHLQDSITLLARSRLLTGHDTQKLIQLSRALKHQDPFVSYSASRAAIALMQDKSIYH